MIIEEKQREIQILRNMHYSTLEENKLLNQQLMKRFDDKQNVLINYEFIMWSKIKDLEIKIKIILEDQEKYNKFDLKLQHLHKKLDNMLKQYYILEIGKIQILQQSLNQLIQQKTQNQLSIESKLIKQDIEHMRISDFLQSLSANMKVQFAKFKQDFDKILSTLNSTKQKQIPNYSNSLGLLNKQIEGLNKKLTIFQQQKKEKISQFKLIENKYQSLISSVKNTTEMTKQNKLKQESVFKKVQSQNYDTKKATISSTSEKNLWSSRLHTLPNESERNSSSTLADDYFYQSNQNKSEKCLNLAKQQKNKVNVQKTQRLKSTLQKMKIRMPLKCEIDQTGNLKYFESGTYIYDNQGNLFQLNQIQIQYAIKSKIILI